MASIRPSQNTPVFPNMRRMVTWPSGASCSRRNSAKLSLATIFTPGLAAWRPRPVLFRGHLLRAAEQFHIESPAGKQHVVQRFVDVTRRHRLAGIARDGALRDPPHQLLDEGGADAFRAAQDRKSVV